VPFESTLLVPWGDTLDGGVLGSELSKKIKRKSNGNNFINNVEFDKFIFFFSY
jgi:hypothetical protein